MLNEQAHSFEVEEDSTAYSSYVSGGIATQVKESVVLSFRSLAESLKDPGEFLLTDFAKLERSPLLHIGFQALDAFTVRAEHSLLHVLARVHALPCALQPSLYFLCVGVVRWCRATGMTEGLLSTG